MQLTYPHEPGTVVTQESGPPVIGCAASVYLRGLPADELGAPPSDLIDTLKAAAQRFSMTEVTFDGRDRLYLVISDVDPVDAMATGERVQSAVQRAASDSGMDVEATIGLSSFPFYVPSLSLAGPTSEVAMCWAAARGGNRIAHWAELMGGVPGAGGAEVVNAVPALVAALEWKTQSDAGQTARSAWYALRVADALQLDPQDKRTLEWATLLHDIGKIGVPDAILNKPGRLTDEELHTVRLHPLIGFDIIGSIPGMAPIAQIIAHHHEHFDGSGYPDGLSGETIPLGARIIMVADAFDAMTTARSYRSILSFQAAAQEIERNAGHQFDPTVAKVFVQVVQKQGPQAIRWSMGDGATRRTGPAGGPPRTT